ncbi:hypothetical protein ACR77J_07445 [Tissierella praeacuta]|uniref:hypothetical protein n=1 Tax=Tissierella praeacuta TaxID=43131 RepID=UPI003DA270FB
MDNIKDKFIMTLVDELNEINKDRTYNNKFPLDICFMTSVLDQQLENCKEFMGILENKNWLINGYERDEDDYYTNGRIRVLIEKPKEERKSGFLVDTYENYCYYIEFLEDNRPWGDCRCNSDYEEYNPKYKCCGIGCDWVAPAFRIVKEIDVHYDKWDGYEKDYWSYKERFEENEKITKQQEKEQILDHIKKLQDRLSELE